MEILALTLEYKLFLVTIILGIAAILAVMISQILSLSLFLKERSDRYQTEIKDRINSLLERSQRAFEDLGIAIEHRDKEEVQQALNLFDIYAKLSLDHLTPSIYESQHSFWQYRSYRLMLIKTLSHSIPVAVEHLKVSLKVNTNFLNQAKTNNSSAQIAIYQNRVEKIEKLLNLKESEGKQLKHLNKRLLWEEANRELKNFREIFSGVWTSIVDSYDQMQKDNSQANEGWNVLENAYKSGEIISREFRGNLESLFINF